MKQAIALITIWMSVALTPWLDDLLKVWIIATSIILTLTINLIFRIAALRDMIVEHLVQAILARLMEDEDMKKVVKMKFDAMMIKVKEGKQEKANA